MGKDDGHRPPLQVERKTASGRDARSTIGQLQGFDANDVGVGLYRGLEVGAGFGVELDAAAGGGGAFEDDVLDFFDVGVGAADLVHDVGEHADAVVMADNELPFRGRAGGEVDAVGQRRF